MTENLPNPPPNVPILQRWDPRLKIIALLVLAFSFSSVSDLRAVPAMIVLTLFFQAISGMPVRTLLRRLRYPSLMIVLLVVILPFAGGKTPLIQMGFLTISREGLESALLIAARFYSILALAIIFLGGSPILTNIRAFQALGLPYIMADMALLMARYLDVLALDMRRMRRAMQLRGHEGGTFSLKTLRTTAWLAGSLLLRSHERAEGVYKAMRLRGYGARESQPARFSAAPADGAALAAVTVMAMGLIWLG